MPSHAFVDPRTRPLPPWSGPRRRLTADATELASLIHAISRGRLYDVEEWVRTGRPIQFKTPKVRPWTKQSPLEVAVRYGEHDAALLLLCNGYDPLRERVCPATLALRVNRRDILDLVLAWGADPKRIDAHEAVACHDVALLERLWRLRVDFTRGDALSHSVARATSNRQLYGFLKRHAHEDAGLQAELNRGLCRAVDRKDGNEKAVSFCVWAGADPWAFVPEGWDKQDERDASDRWRLYRSAVGKAVSMGKGALLRVMKVAPAHPRFQDLYRFVYDVTTFDALAALEPPRDPDAVATLALSRLGWGRYGWSSEASQLLERAFAAGGCVRDVSDHTCKELRKLLASDRFSLTHPRNIVRMLQDPAHMAEEAFLKMISSPAVLDEAQRLGIRRANLEALAASPSAKQTVGVAARRAIRKNRKRKWFLEEGAEPGV